jgi:hypothetical protein
LPPSQAGRTLAGISGSHFQETDMTELATDPLTLGHTAISLIVIALGLLVLG